MQEPLLRVDRPRAVLAMRPGLQHLLFDAPLRARLAALVDVDFDTTWRGEGLADTAEVEVLLTGWGVPRLSTEVLDAMPSLRAVLHGGGTVWHFLDEEVWRRDIRVTSAADANAVPVAQFASSAIVLALKDTFRAAARYARRDAVGPMASEEVLPGVLGRSVGIIGASRTGRGTIELLRRYGCRLLLADPYVDEFAAAELGVELVSLEELFDRSDVVSVHAPDLPATRGMVDVGLLRRLRDGATLINTARPALIDHEALLAELRTGRIFAILDVTDPEPLPPGHALLSLENVLVTPHLAGAHGSELALLGQAMVDELERYLSGQDARDPVRLEEADVRA